MYTSEEFDQLLKSATAGSLEARRLLDQHAANMAEIAFQRQIVRNRLMTLAPRSLQLVLQDTSRNPDFLAFG